MDHKTEMMLLSFELVTNWFLIGVDYRMIDGPVICVCQFIKS